MFCYARLFLCISFASVNTDCQQDKSCYVSAAALSKYMRLDGDETTADGSKPEESSVFDLDSGAIACAHQKLCPVVVSKSKRISTVRDI